jgi:hypothetical protein
MMVVLILFKPVLDFKPYYQIDKSVPT